MAPEDSTIGQGAADFALARALVDVVRAEPAPRLEEALGELCRAALGGESGLCLLNENADGLANWSVPEGWRGVVAEMERSRVPVVAEGKIACPVGVGGTLLGMLGVAKAGAASSDAERLQGMADLVAQILDTRLAFDGRQQALQRSEEQLERQRQIIDQIHDSVIAMDIGGYITSWNKGAEALFGYTAEEAVGKNILFLYADENEEDSLFHDLFLGQQGSREMMVRRRKKSGEVFWASLTLSLYHDRDGHPAGIVGYLSDITERLRYEEQLRLQAAIFENSGEGIVVADAQNRIVSVNRAFTRITGYAAQEALGRMPEFLRSDLHDSGFYEEMRRSIVDTGRWVGELWSRRKEGEQYPIWLSTSSVKNREGETTHYFSVFSDITERKNAEEKIHQLAHFDALTGLPNRAMLHSLLRHAIAEARRHQRYGAVLFVDLDRFKQVNDYLGPALGDQLLTDVAQLIKSCLRNEDIVARLGGDEFVAALFDIAQREDTSRVAEKILKTLSQPIFVGGDGHEVHISASIGISVYPDDGEDPETLVRNAEVAMFRVKQGEGRISPEMRGCHLFFSREMNQRVLERLTLERNLSRALERGELRLNFQPQLDLHSGEMVAAEVLLRWQHPELGLVPPSEFIPIAEETGLIVPIGDWILETVCRKNKAWQDAGLPIVKLAVNISARQFRQELPRRVEELLEGSGLDPAYLELEITESMVMRHAEGMIDLMSRFQKLGVGISLDDFGTGYSSLNYLKRFPLDKLKIDQSFVRGLPADAGDSAIARAVIGLAKNLDLKVIAEGVETAEQREFLREAGCDEIQGYHYSRPLAEDDFLRFLRQAGTG